ncbi:MAG TPA: elongation factor G [Sediminispirochaeta sp.]|nr:elongation factor G [Sediminispirochaeta sp.]
MSFTTADIKNVAIIGHSGTGKTTLLEQVLYNGGVIPKAESVAGGKTTSDFTDEEIERQISIHTALAHVEWNDHELNLLDTPGIADFVGEVVASLRAAESALMVVGARSGVQIETVKLWRRLDNRKMPRTVFINKLDVERASFDSTFADLQEKFDKTFVPVTIPIGSGVDYKGIVNLIENKAYLVHDQKDKDQPSEVPADMADQVEEYRLTMIESAAEGDDELMEKYFEEGTLTEDEIRRGLLEGLRDNKIVPVLCGSAELNNGVTSLLNFLINNAPSPSTYTETAYDEEENEIQLPFSVDEPLCGIVFKTSIDQFSGKLSYVKVVDGVLSSETELLNYREQKKEKLNKVFKVNGRKLTEVKELIAGDIGVITKMDSLHTNDTICAPDRPIHLKALALPHPVYALTVLAADRKSEDKLNDFLHRITEEDLTFNVSFNPETKESVISGMGELHINMILDRIKEKQKLNIETRTPKVAYRETITKPANAEYTHKKQTGGHGQFARVVMEIKPLERGEKFSFENAIRGQAVSKGYMPGIEKGLLEGMEEGYLAGYPLVDIGATIVDGKEHPVDSSEMAFKQAGKGALKAALEKADPVLLEPIMRLNVFVDEQYLGDILSDLSAKRGRVQGQENLGGGIIRVYGEVPQAEMLRYAIDLRSITSGTGSFELEFDHYEVVRGKIAEEIIAKSKEEATQESQ